MKKTLILTLLIPVLSFGQDAGDYFMQINKGYIYDEFMPDEDINPWSPDMQTEYEGRDDAKEGVQYSIGYYIADKILLGVNYMDAEISGANEIECYEGIFTEKNVFMNYTLLNTEKGLSAFVSASYGNVEWESNRSLMFDEGVIPLNSYSGDAKKYSYGAGLSYALSKDVELSFSVSRNKVNHDGFDGWDYGSATDQYLYKSIGIRLYLRED